MNRRAVVRQRINDNAGFKWSVDTLASALDRIFQGTSLPHALESQNYANRIVLARLCER